MAIEAKDIKRFTDDFHKRLRQLCRYTDSMNTDDLIEIMGSLEAVKENIEYLENIVIKRLEKE